LNNRDSQHAKSKNIFLSAFDKKIDFVISNKICNDEMIILWENIYNNKFIYSNTRNEGVYPLTKAEWGQGFGYNESCPYDPDCSKHVPTGCGATAIAIIMKYWGIL